MRVRNALDRMFSPVAGGLRPRRQISPAVRSLEGRLLLSGAPTATMTQTATFPNLESLPNVATQALLYFSSTMGTLTEVDVVTSGSYSTAFAAENLGTSSTAITGTTSGNLAINLPSGPIPVNIPAVTESFNASAYDGTDNDAGASGKGFAPETSTAVPQTTVMTSTADLAAFTGNFRIPITVTGHATGSATSTDGDISDNFQTQTSVTVTVVYHYIPNLPSLNPSPPASTQSAGGQGSGAGGATSGAPASSSTGQATALPDTVATVQSLSTQKHKKSVANAEKKAPKVVKPAHHPLAKPKPIAHSHKGKSH